MRVILGVLPEMAKKKRPTPLAVRLPAGDLNEYKDELRAASTAAGHPSVNSFVVAAIAEKVNRTLATERGHRQAPSKGPPGDADAEAD